MSIARRAARGVAWNMAASIVTRVVQLGGTLALTRFIAPAAYGEVSAAVVCVLTASQLSTFSFGQYLIAHRSPPKHAFQAATLHVAMGLFAMLVLIALREPLGALVEVPSMGRLVPGLALASMIDRLRLVPERLLVRDLRFRSVALVNSAGELVFTGCALALAPRWGGAAIVGGGVARSVVTAILFIGIAPRSEWLVPSPIEPAFVRSLMGYGVWIMLGALADRAASTWDNLLVSRLFGAGVLGRYNLAYSLAETPLTYVGDRIGDVLMPSFAKMEEGRRPAAVVRAAGIMMILVAPLGVGLGAVAPSVVFAFFDARWAEMAPMLTLLSVMAVFQPAPWSAVAYLQAQRKTRLIMITSVARAAMLLALVFVLGKLGGPLWACVGVGAGMTLHSVVTILLTASVTDLPAGPYLVAVARPLLACAPMFVVVLLVRRLLEAAGVHVALSLIVQIVSGALAYVAALFVFVRRPTLELWRLGGETLGRRAEERAP